MREEERGKEEGRKKEREGGRRRGRKGERKRFRSFNNLAIYCLIFLDKHVFILVIYTLWHSLLIFLTSGGYVF